MDTSLGSREAAVRGVRMEAIMCVVVVTPNFFTVGREGAQGGEEEGKAEK